MHAMNAVRRMLGRLPRRVRAPAKRIQGVCALPVAACRYWIGTPSGGAGQVGSSPAILLVSHELSETGAPRMLLYAARALRAAGARLVVVAPADGPLRQAFRCEGIPVILDAALRDGHVLFERFARNFDLAIINTVVVATLARQLAALPDLRCLWWLHEPEMLRDLAKIPDGVAWSRLRLLCVSDYARSFLPAPRSAEVLRCGIPDSPLARGARPHAAGPLTFVCSGSIEPNKGQDLLVEAVALLPPGIRRDCRFVISGKLWDANRGFWEPLTRKMATLPEIAYVGPVDHERNLALIAGGDVLVCPSRNESALLVVMEAAMLGRPAILSDRVGAAECLLAGSHFRFRAGDAAALAAQIAAAQPGGPSLPAWADRRAATTRRA